MSPTLILHASLPSPRKTLFLTHYFRPFPDYALPITLLMDDARPPPLILDRAPPRPAPTAAYSCLEKNPALRVLYIQDHREANKQLKLLGPGPHVLGFDIEWKPIYVKGAPENRIALIQLANNHVVLLLQITAMQGKFNN